MKSIAALFAFVTGLFAAPLPAAAEVIACPFETPVAQAPTSLPPGWWTSRPGTNSFLIFAAANGVSQTEIVDFGGATLLRCIYGDFGALSRQAPPGLACVAADGGFACDALN